MGVGASQQSKLEREFGGIGDGEGEERFFGLENFGNTCYCNSVLQALYFCEPLRYHLAQVREEDASGSGGDNVVGKGGGNGKAGKADGENSVLSQLAELFSSISKQKRRSGHLAPREFLRTLQERNELFRGNKQQDAHEFFNFVLNDMADSLVARRKKKQRQRQQQEENKSLHHESGPHQAQPQPEKHAAPQAPSGHQNHQHRSQQHPRSYAWPKMHSLKGSMGNGSKIGPPTNGGMRFATSSAPSSGKGEDKRSLPPAPLANGASGGHAGSGGGGDDDDSGETWVHRIFQGVLTNETKCLCCETVSNRDEPFMDLSLDVEQNSSVTACLRSFSNTETLTKKNKFFCENCNALQEAEKKIQLKRLPRVLTLHLKRFKYVESLESFSKLSHRVVFPLELRAPNMTDGQGEADADGRLYRLFAVVVHIGRGPNHGHYVAVVKSGGRWLLFDDDIVELVNEEVLRQCYGLARPASTETNTGYLLLYDCGKESGEPPPPPPFGQER